MSAVPPILQVVDFEVRKNPRHPECEVSILFVLHEGLCWRVELGKEHGLRLARQLQELLAQDFPTHGDPMKQREESQ